MNLTLAAQALRLLADALEAPATSENADLLGKQPAETPTPEDDKPKRTRRTKAEMEADAKKESAPTAETASTTDTSSTTTAPSAETATQEPSAPSEAELAQALTEKCKDFPRQQVTALLKGKRLSDHTAEERIALKAALDGLKKSEEEAW